MAQLTKSEREAAQAELDRSSSNIELMDKRRQAAIRRALMHPMPSNRRTLRAQERAFAYPVTAR